MMVIISTINKIYFMKNTRSFYCALIVIGTLAACQGTDKSGERYKDSTSLGERADSAGRVGGTSPTKNETSETKVGDDEAVFMKAAAMGSSMEIELGKYAMKNSENAKVKEFAAKMVADHTLALSDLMKIAMASAIVLPPEFPADVKSHMGEMMKMKGKAFDDHYVEIMVKDHAKTITLFKAAKSLREDAVKDYVAKTLPILQTHQTLANELAASIK